MLLQIVLSSNKYHFMGHAGNALMHYLMHHFAYCVLIPLVSSWVLIINGSDIGLVPKWNQAITIP